MILEEENMKYLVNSREMQLYDKNTSERFKVPSLLLMEQAALAACEEIEKLLLKERLLKEPLYADRNKKILIVCGIGNNGGDGLAVGRILFLKGYPVELVLIGDEKKASEQNLKQQEILNAYGVPVLKEIPDNETYQMTIDAIFGVGLARNIEGSYKTSIEKMNALSGSKIALDIPSGVSADNGAIFGTAFRADVTITFAFDKVGLHLWPGNEKTGRIVVKEIGITKHSFLTKMNTPIVRALEETDLEFLKKRPSHSNKGTFGKLLVIAGSVNMAGAAILAGKSAYAAGCGLVRILTPSENRVIIQTALPEAVLTCYDSENLDTGLVTDAVKWADAIVIGPGIGTNEAAERILRLTLTQTRTTIVFDADALNLIPKNIDLFKASCSQKIITPHLGEMSRLTGKEISFIQSNLLETAKTYADTYRVICVLKDEHTITSIPDGNSFLNLTGNSGMATAGSGDVLSGVIGSFIAQGCTAEKAAVVGVYVHGLAGDYIVKKTGKAGLMASDLIEGIRLFFRELSDT